MTEMEVAAGTEPVASSRTGFRRLMVSLGITGGTQSAMYAGIGSVLLPSQLEQIDRAHKVAALGLVAGVSAIFATVFNPLGGSLSDRTRSRFGRRAPWLIGASAALLPLLAFLGQARAVLLVLLGWCLAQATANMFQAPLAAVIPDRVAATRRGTASSVAGVASILGGVTGIGLAGLFTGHLAAGYLVLGGLLILAASQFVLRTPARRTWPR